MTSKQKIKGSNFEREIAEVLSGKIKGGKFRRIPSSGSIGTIMGESNLTGDISGEVKSFPKKLKGECKVGYSNNKAGEAKSISLKKEWIDKIRAEAKLNYSFPFFAGKFENVREGTKYFIALDVEEFAYILNLIHDLQEELDLRETELSYGDNVGKSSRSN